MKLNTMLAAGLCMLACTAFTYGQAQPGQTGTTPSGTATVQPGTVMNQGGLNQGAPGQALPPGSSIGPTTVIVVPSPVPVAVPVAVPVIQTPPSYSLTTRGLNPAGAGSGLVPVPGGALPGTVVPGTVTPGTLPR